MVELGYIRDHHQVVLNCSDRDAARDIVGARQHQHGRRPQVNDIGPHPAQHFTGYLPADTAVHEVAPGEIFV